MESKLKNGVIQIDWKPLIKESTNFFKNNSLVFRKSMVTLSWLLITNQYMIWELKCRAGKNSTSIIDYGYILNNPEKLFFTLFTFFNIIFWKQNLKDNIEFETHWLNKWLTFGNGISSVNCFSGKRFLQLPQLTLLTLGLCSHGGKGSAQSASLLRIHKTKRSMYPFSALFVFSRDVTMI